MTSISFIEKGDQTCISDVISPAFYIIGARHFLSCIQILLQYRQTYYLSSLLLVKPTRQFPVICVKRHIGCFVKCSPFKHFLPFYFDTKVDNLTIFICPWSHFEIFHTATMPPSLVTSANRGTLHEPIVQTTDIDCKQQGPLHHRAGLIVQDICGN